jgi:hypothetical protein
MAKRKPSHRAEDRARSRAHGRLVRDLERLAAHAPGGSPGRPVTVEASSLVEPIAEGTACPLCEGKLSLLEHAAETHEGVRLRVAHVRCTHCGVARALYFRLTAPSLN